MEATVEVAVKTTRAEETEQGEILFRRGGVRVLSNDGKSVRFAVTNQKRREVIIRMEQPPLCSCDTFKHLGICRHIAAAECQLKQSGVYDDMIRRRAQIYGPRLFEAMEDTFPKAGTMLMEVTLFLDTRSYEDETTIRVGIRIGEDRLYVVRSLPQFLDAIADKEPLSFGKGFTFQPDWMTFGKEETRVLNVLRALCVARGEAGSARHGAQARTMRLPDVFKRQLLEALNGLRFRLAVDGEMYSVNEIGASDLPIHYTVTGSHRGLTLRAEFAQGIIPVLKNCEYIYLNGALYTTDKYKQAVLPLLIKQQTEGTSLFSFEPSEFERFFSELLPFLHMSGTVQLEDELKNKLISHPLKTRIYLDKQGAAITARVIFAYGENEIDPFQPESAKGLLLLRDPRERVIVDELANAGFRVKKGSVYLVGQEAIWDFFENGLTLLEKDSEMFLSREFKRMKPKKPLLQGSMRLKGNRLELDLTDDGKPLEELLPIMEALKMRKQYFRLQSGAFLDLRGMEEWHAFAEAVYDGAEIEGKTDANEQGTLALNACRSLYFNALLKQCALPVQPDTQVHQAVDDLYEPKEMATGYDLRPYQRRGLGWLLALHRMHMGGILADDMGLGKTIQVISLIMACVENEGRQPSVVVCPSSLCYNWQAEIKRFAPKLKTLVLSGSQGKRTEDIMSVRDGQVKADVVITSYPLIRRDIVLLSTILFRFAILDEAQYIKNAQSVGASAVKQLNAQTRFALSGTPMENSVSELWSLFDFVLPGYLGTYSSFLHRYADGGHNDELLRKIRPFLLRRLKTEVLCELPLKLETTLYAQLSPEQALVYSADKRRLYERVDGLLKEKGMRKGRTEVLSAITELRQICCHPTLCLPDYSGTSGKMELLMDLLATALDGGRRVLLFSQFTGMLKLLKRRFTADGITSLYLDGETPPSNRLAMTKRFNEGEGQVFLISLKAGGTGLNLTGADMVIHFDPWWNPAAEEQATDRAYRIGQKNRVEVIKLITHDTIEEQVQRLSKKKKALFDRLIVAGEEMPDKLTEADVRALFT